MNSFKELEIVCQYYLLWKPQKSVLALVLTLRKLSLAVRPSKAPANSEQIVIPLCIVQPWRKLEFHFSFPASRVGIV